MPKQLVLSHVPEHLSIVEFDLDVGEDIFFTYTWERRQGPEIRRTGMGPPFMDLIGGRAREITTHAFGLRLGTWLISEDLRDDELNEARKELERAQMLGLPREDVAVLQRTVDELDSIPAHDKVFKQCYPEYRIIGQQGCGDLTMNSWNVAYFNNKLARNPPEPDLVYLPSEPLEYRSYSCLVKWKQSESSGTRVTIEEARLRTQGLVKEPNEMVWVRFGENWLPRADSIDFAVSNQQVIRHGEPVPVVTIGHQFGDLRHLLQMPNLNPAGPLYPSEPTGRDGNYRPRQYFNQDQFSDIWLGEGAFLQDGTQNLLRAALAGPVFLDLPGGAVNERVRGALSLAGYQEISSALKALAPGDWRFVHRDPQVTVLEVYFKRNTYGWTMIGLSSDERRILCLACTGKPGKTGYTLEQATDVLLRAGAQNALLMDEGADAFQRVRWGADGIHDLIPRYRGRVRATFTFGRRVEASGE